MYESKGIDINGEIEEKLGTIDLIEFIFEQYPGNDYSFLMVLFLTIYLFSSS